MKTIFFSNIFTTFQWYGHTKTKLTKQEEEKGGHFMTNAHRSKDTYCYTWYSEQEFDQTATGFLGL